MKFPKIVFVKTSDNFNKSFKINNETFVKITLEPLGPKYINWRIAAWGNDDYGLIQDSNDYNELLEIFIDIILMDDVTQLDLENLGFVMF